MKDATINFKKHGGAFSMKQLGTFIRGYQVEIDRLTTRARSVERDYGTLAQALLPLPDPSPSMLPADEAGRGGEEHGKILDDLDAERKLRVAAEGRSRQLEAMLSDTESDLKSNANLDIEHLKAKLAETKASLAQAVSTLAGTSDELEDANEQITAQKSAKQGLAAQLAASQNACESPPHTRPACWLCPVPAPCLLSILSTLSVPLCPSGCLPSHSLSTPSARFLPPFPCRDCTKATTALR